MESNPFEIAADTRPVPAEVRKTREQIIELAREQMVKTWDRLKKNGNHECAALELADLEKAEPKVEESVIRAGTDKGQKIYQIVFLVPNEELEGNVQFAWSFTEFGRMRSMAGVRLVDDPR